MLLKLSNILSMLVLSMLVCMLLIEIVCYLLR